MKYLIILLLLIPGVLAYPVIITNEGTNLTQNKELIYSYPEEVFEFVKIIEFVPEPFKMGNRTLIGYVSVFWDSYHNCYWSEIWMVNDRVTLLHELGHVHDFCKLKQDFSTEESADNFEVEI